MKRVFGTIILAFVSILCISSTARADWINLTGAQSAPNIAEVYVEDNHVRLVLFIAGSVLLYPFLEVAVARPAAMVPKMTDSNAVIVLNSLPKNI